LFQTTIVIVLAKAVFVYCYKPLVEANGNESKIPFSLNYMLTVSAKAVLFIALNRWLKPTAMN
jgi:hypothetical protein